MPAIDIDHTFSLTIGGTEVWSKVNTGSLIFTDNEGSQIDTLVFELTDVTDALEVTEWQEVIWTLDGSDVAFGGYVVTPKPRLGANGAYRIWTVTCESYTTKLARTTIVRKTYVNQDVADIIVDLFNQALDPTGTPPAQTAFDVTTHVTSGQTLDLFVTDGQKLGKLLDALATVVTNLAAATWTWRIDASANLWFGPASSDTAPFSIARIASANWSTSFPPLKDPDNSVDATDIRNRITVRGGVKASDPVTETFSGDGATTTFALTYKPVRTMVRITVGGVLQSYGVDWYDTFGGGYDALVNYSAGTVRWPDVSPPGIGVDNISITYVYNENVTAQAEDAASQAQYGLWFDYEVPDSTITTEDAATEIANALLTEYAYGVATGTLEVARWGIRAGQRLQVEFSTLGFTGYYAVRQVVTTLTGPESVSCRVSFGGHTAKLSNYVGGGAAGTGGAYSQPTTPAFNGEVQNLYVNEWIASIDRSTTFTSMSDYGTATGVVFGWDPTSGAGMLLGLNAGTLQAYFDSDGSIKAGGGDVALDADGIKITSGTGDPNALKWVNAGGDTKFSIKAVQPSPPDILFNVTVYASAGNLDLVALSGLSINTLGGDILIDSSGALQFVVGSGTVDFNSLRLVEVGDATADTDALNRQTGDARYQHWTTNIMVVDADGNGNYSTIGAAVTAINTAGDAAADNPYVIEVWTGIYVENVTLPDYVSLRGHGWKATTLSGVLTCGGGSHVDDLTIYAPDPATTSVIANSAVDTSYFTNCYIVINTSVDAAVHAIRFTGSTDARFYNCFIYARNPNAGGSAKTYIVKHEGTGGDVEIQECHLKSSCPHVGGNTLAWNASATAGADIIVLASSWSVFNDAAPVGADNDNASGQIKLAISFENDSDDEAMYTTSGSGIINEVALLDTGTRPLIADWDAGSYEIRAQTFESDVATGTAPLTIASTTIVNNLNAQYLNSVASTGFLLTTGAQTGASAQAQTFTNGIIGPSWKPVANSTTALQMQNAAGTSILNVDTTNARVGIGTISPTTGYKLDVVGNIITNQTVNQSTYPSISATQIASTLQDGSAYTGTDSTMATQYVAVKFTADGNHTMGDYLVRIKESADITNTTAYVVGYLYADDGGSPSKPTGAALATGNSVRLGTITTSYQELSVGTQYTLTSGASYWLVLKYSAAPTGGNIVLDSDVSTNLGATSTDGSTWTNTDARLRYKIRGRTYYGVFGTSTNSVGVFGNSTNSIGVYGISTNSYGVYGNSTNNIGVYGISTNSYGVYGNSTNNIGVFGTSTNSVGVYGISTNNIGVFGTSTNYRAGYFYRNNTAGTATTAVMDIVQDSATSETNTVLRVQGDGTGDLVNIFDGATEVFTILDGGNVGIGTTGPATRFHTLLTDAGTDAIVNVATLGHDTSGTAAAGFGLGLAFNLESSTTAAQSAALISTLWYEATHATRKADLVLSAYDTAAREGIRIRGAGTESALGFYGVAPIVRAVLATGAGAVVDDVITALQNLGLVKQS